MQIFTKGVSHFLILVLVSIVIGLLISPAKRYINLYFNHLTAKIGINLNNIASEQYVSWIKSQQDELVSNNQAIFLNRNVPFTDIALRGADDILGESVNQKANKYIEVDISEQRLYMKEDGNIVGSFLVSTGKWAPTPTGEWRIWTKLRYTRMKGGSKALGTFYDLPNVPYTMYYNQGYGIHGAYWHNNFGQPMSHGCVNMKPEEAGVVFSWASVGTRVVVHI